jgi:hypothetical protein
VGVGKRDRMSIDYGVVLRCLDEIDGQLLEIGKTKCKSLNDDTQLSAVVTLLFRASSLLRSLLGLLKRGELDSYDVVRRAFYEAWLLAFEFRLLDSRGKAAKWHKGVDPSWSPDISKLQSYSKSQGIDFPSIGRDYGGLSEVAHPTKKSAWHSIRVTTARHEECPDVTGAKAKLERADVPELLHSLVWIIDERPEWIAMGVDSKGLTNALAYARLYAERPE